MTPEEMIAKINETFGNMYFIRQVKTLAEVKKYGKGSQVICMLDGTNRIVNVVDVMYMYEQIEIQKNQKEEQHKFDVILNKVKAVLTEDEYQIFCQSMMPQAS